MRERKNKYAETVYKKWNGGVEKAFKGASPRDRLLIAASNAVAAFVSFIFTVVRPSFFRNALGYPLMYAYVCASGRFSLGAFAGAFYGLYKTSSQASEYIVLFAIILIRLVSSRYLASERKIEWLFTESSLLRLSACALLCMLRSAMRLPLGEITPDILKNMLVTLVSAPIVCTLFLLYFSGERGIKGVRRFLYYTSMTALFSLTVYCASGIYYIGVNVGILTAVFLTLAVSKYGGMLAGASMGALLGALTGIYNTIPLALIGASSGIFFSLGALSAAGISVAVGAISAILLNGIGAVTGFIPEAVISVAFSSPVLKYCFLPTDFPFPHDLHGGERNFEKFASVTAAQNGSKRLLKLSGAFFELSESVSNGVSKYSEQLAEDIKSDFCESCPMSPICWENERKNAYSSLTEISELYLSGKKDIRGSIPPWLSERCVRLKELCAAAEKKASGVYTLATNKRAIKNFDFLNISEILEDIAHSMNEESKNDDELSRKVIRACYALGHRIQSATVLGKSRKQVCLYGIAEIKNSEAAEKLRSSVSEICNEEFMRPVFADGNAFFSSALKLRTESSHAEEIKDGEPCSGDRTVSFTTDDGCFYSVITDGMGSGREASECSEYACAMLEKLLRCNIKKSVAVRILGELLRKRFKECFTTVDIMKLDLVTGQTDFLKSGAANSYVIRGGAVHCVSSRTMPIGINSDAFSEEAELELRDGDTVVMMSDGVASEPSDGVWLTRALSSGDLKSPAALADELIANAVKKRGLTDDMTVSVIKILRAS